MQKWETNKGKRKTQAHKMKKEYKLKQTAIK